KELNFVRNNTIKSVTADLEHFSFNTAVARLMEFVNALYAYDSKVEVKNELFTESIKDLILLFAPFAPHFSEELNEMMGGKESVFNQRYPIYDEKALKLDEVEYAVQINSKIKNKVMISSDASNEEIEAIAKEAVKEFLNGQTVVKAIIIPGRLVNLIAK
ncbi:MAG: class I tRNA ligase family protein, partial [Clostridiales bacterium]|nr:class I tRNA ligase family protein [Clostridiales bacterium]